MFLVRFFRSGLRLSLCLNLHSQLSLCHLQSQCTNPVSLSFLLLQCLGQGKAGMWNRHNNSGLCRLKWYSGDTCLLTVCRHFSFPFCSRRQTGQVKLWVRRSGKLFTHKYVALAGQVWYQFFFKQFFFLFSLGIKNFKLIICDFHWLGWLFLNKKEEKAFHQETSLVAFTSPPSHYLCPDLNKVRLGL